MLTSPSTTYRRHSAAVRVMHWINAAAVAVLLMSGLQIFNAYPELHWGRQSYSGRGPLLAIDSRDDAGGAVVGTTTILGRTFQTTGLLGTSRAADGDPARRAFPAWATLPGFQSLAIGRRWHFFFAWVLVLNGLAYCAYSIFSRHLWRDLWPNRRDLRGIGRSIADHLRFRHPRGDAAKRYNVLQKLIYLMVIFLIFPGIVLMGLAMSPTLNTLLPGWIDTVGGRQSARTLHFLAALMLALFVLIHVFEVIVTGAFNNLRSMITGNYRVPAARSRDEENTRHD